MFSTMFKSVVFLTAIAVPIGYLQTSDSTVELLKEHAEVAKRMMSQQAAESQLKLEALRVVIGDNAEKYMAQAKVKIEELWVTHLKDLKLEATFQNVKQSIVHVLQENDISQERFLKLSSDLYDSGLQLASSLSDVRFSDVAQWVRHDKTGQRVLCTVLMIIGLLACCLLVSSRRRRAREAVGSVDVAVSQSANGALTKILSAPTPLRERPLAPIPAVQRRRRTDSPAPVADSENTAPDATAADLLEKLNNNDATELCSLQGLGDKSAEKIIKWRTKNGPLKTVQDLKKAGLPGIVIGNLTRHQSIN